MAIAAMPISRGRVETVTRAELVAAAEQTGLALEFLRERAAALGLIGTAGP